MTQSPEFTVTCGLRWSDFDPLGHLNQATYHVLIEQARIGWLSSVRPFDPESTDSFVLARVELDHLTEVGTGHREVVASCAVGHVGTSSVVCEQEVRMLDGTVAARAKTILVAFDLAARGKRALSDDERALFGAAAG